MPGYKFTRLRLETDAGIIAVHHTYMHQWYVFRKQELTFPFISHLHHGYFDGQLLTCRLRGRMQCTARSCSKLFENRIRYVTAAEEETEESGQ